MEAFKNSRNFLVNVEIEKLIELLPVKTILRE